MSLESEDFSDISACQRVVAQLTSFLHALNKAAFAPVRGTVQSNSFVQLYGWVVVKTCLRAEACEQPNKY